MSDRIDLLPFFWKTIEKYDDGVGRILDVGCGYLYGSFANKYGDRYVGLDVKELPWPKSVIGDAHDLSRYDDNSFRLVALFSVLEHLKEPYKALSEATRVASRAVLLTTDFTQADKDTSNNHYYSWTPKILRHLLNDFGKTRVWVERDILCGVIEK